MAWERRKGTSERYYTRTTRGPKGRRRRVYFGNGPLAELAALQDAILRAECELLWRDTHDRRSRLEPDDVSEGIAMSVDILRQALAPPGGGELRQAPPAELNILRQALAPPAGGEPRPTASADVPRPTAAARQDASLGAECGQRRRESAPTPKPSDFGEGLAMSVDILRQALAPPGGGEPRQAPPADVPSPAFLAVPDALGERLAQVLATAGQAGGDGKRPVASAPGPSVSGGGRKRRGAGPVEDPPKSQAKARDAAYAYPQMR